MGETRSTTGRPRRVAAAVVAVAVAGAGVVSLSCTSSASERRLVAATVFPVFDLTRRVPGGRLDVRLILAPRLDPHDYEPRPKDVAGLADASLIFAVGLGLDPWAQGLARSAGAGEARVFEPGPLMDPILAPPGLTRPEPLIDPHFWTDPPRIAPLRSSDPPTTSARSDRPGWPASSPCPATPPATSAQSRGSSSS